MKNSNNFFAYLESLADSLDIGQRKKQDEKDFIRRQQDSFSNPNSAISKSFAAIRTKSAQKKSKMFFDSVDCFDEDTQMIFDIIESGLDGLKADELRYICKEIGLPYSGRKKGQLIESIKEWKRDVLSRTNTTSEGDNTTYHDPETMQYIAEHSLHVAITRKVVDKIASIGKAEQDGTTKKIHFDGVEACIDIVKSNFQQVIFEDISQDMYLTLYTLWESGYIRIANGHIENTDIMTGYDVRIDGDKIRKGLKPEQIDKLRESHTIEIVAVSHRSIWNNYFTSVRNTLRTYKSADTQRAKAGNWIIDDNGDLIGENSTRYIGALIESTHDIDTALSDTYISEFLVAFTKQYPKYGTRFSNLIYAMMIEGTKTLKQACADIGISHDQGRYTVMLAKSFYFSEKWDSSITQIRHTPDKSNRYGCKPLVNSGRGGTGGGYSDLTGWTHRASKDSTSSDLWDKYTDCHGNVYRLPKGHYPRQSYELIYG